MAALLLPWLFFDWSTHRHSGFALTMLSEIGLMSVFALSFNMQMGQAGLLSFGHAILFGLGGYVAAHTLNAIKAGTMWLPVELVPLAGGLGGLVFGALFGYVATQQRATAFAMITMGLGELVAACALMFMAFFGGEGGISTDRVTGTSMLGVSYSSSWQVYCLVVVWTAIATVRRCGCRPRRRSAGWPTRRATISSAPSSSATTRAWCGSTSSRCPASSPASAAGSMPSSTRS